MVALKLARRNGREWENLWPVAAAVFVGGVLGGQLTHLLVEPARSAEYIDFYAILQPHTPGNIVGMLIGGFVGGLAFRIRLGVPSSGNFYAPALAAASIFWRIGCTLGGCCYGKETDLPWAITIVNSRRHPTMIYEGLFNVMALAFILWAQPRIRRDDELLFSYLGGYAFFRFWLEFIRLYPPIWWELTGVQILCLFIIVFLLVYVAWTRFRFSELRLSLR